MRQRHLTLFIAMLAMGSIIVGCSKKKEEAPPPEVPVQEPPVTPPPVPEETPRTGAVKPIPEGFHSLTPGLTVDDVDAALAFYEKHLGAEKRYTMPGPDGKTMHGEMKIGDSIIMLGAANPQMGTKSPKTLGGTNGSLLVYVDDVDKTLATALEGGAKVEMPIMDAFWGDRYVSIADPFGHVWGLATHKEDLTPEQMRERAEAFGKAPQSLPGLIARSPGKKATRTTPEGYHTVTPTLVVADGEKAIEFYQKAFGAEKGTSMNLPDGTLMHAELVIGDSKLMLAGEHPAVAPTHKAPKNLDGAPLTLMLYVEDADQVFKQAIDAGAEEKEKMQDAFWGDRFGMVTDPSGHLWGVATHKEDLTPEQIGERMKKAYEGAGKPDMPATNK